MNEILLYLIGGCFLMVSTAFTGKLIIEAYLEYIQVREGIRVITQKQFEEYMQQLEEEGEDEDSY